MVGTFDQQMTSTRIRLAAHERRQKYIHFFDPFTVATSPVRDPDHEAQQTPPVELLVAMELWMR